MNRSELEHIVRASAEITGEREFIVIGSQATNGAIAWCLDPHDIAYSKLAAGREKDLNYVLALRQHKLISPSQIVKLIEGTIDEELRLRIGGRWQGVENRMMAIRDNEPTAKRTQF